MLEVAQLGPDALGQMLADMGARVVKVETPGEGDPIRNAGPYALGGPDGLGYMHLRWNRGKQSIAIDLRSAEGAGLFKSLAAKADIVIEGMRAGVLDRLGLGYEVLKQRNPKIVFCTLSGMGATGPYAPMASHGPSFDAFGGLAQPPPGVDISKWNTPQPPSIGMYAMGYAAALGVLSALHKAQRTGEGALIEVAAAETAAHWLPEPVDQVLNAEIHHVRPGFADGMGRMLQWPRMDNYRTRDGKLLYIMILYEKYWRNFLKLMQREDLQEIYETANSPQEADEKVAAELAAIFLARTRDDWLALLQANDVPVMPVNSFEDLTRDPHFRARANTYQVGLANGERLTLMASPVRVDGQDFAPALAPELGQHTEAILKDLAALRDTDIEELKTKGVVA